MLVRDRDGVEEWRQGEFLGDDWMHCGHGTGVQLASNLTAGESTKACCLVTPLQRVGYSWIWEEGRSRFVDAATAPG